MSLAKKLNLKTEMSLRVFGKPGNVDLGDVNVAKAAKADGVLVFVKNLAEVSAKCGPVLAAARADELAWVAYPKAGQLATDLNRDVLWRRLLESDVQGVRQIAIDDVWSALRFRAKGAVSGARPGRASAKLHVTAKAPATAAEVRTRAKAPRGTAKVRVRAKAPASPAKVSEGEPSNPRFRALVNALRGAPGVTYGGKGFGSAALKIDDKIFAMWTSKNAFVVKLPKARVTELVEAGKGRYFDAGRGRSMKEWFKSTAKSGAWLSLAKEALEFGRRS
jgi:hypothetical protein